MEGGFETIVVDSGSTDGTAELLRAREDVRTVLKTENVGFARGNNEAAGLARGEVLFFLNPDTLLLSPNVLATLGRVARRPGVGLVGPRLENPDGSLQPSCAAHPGARRALLLASGVHRLLPDRVRARAVPEHWSHDHARDTGWLMGAAIAIRAELFAEVGGFWLTVYGEDTDLARRLQKRGLRVRYEPSARVMHIGNHSGAKRWDPTQRAEQVARADVALLSKHFSRRRAATIRLIMFAGAAVRYVVHRRLGHDQRAAVHRAMARVYASR